MSETNKEQTISFLPNRLNREATVYGGMSVSEFMLAAAVGFVVGGIVGLFLCLLIGFDFWLLIPSFAMLLCILSVVIGKTVVARLKRGMPEAYLNRVIEMKLDILLGGSRFISRQGFWSIRRSRKPR